MESQKIKYKWTQFKINSSEEFLDKSRKTLQNINFFKETFPGILQLFFWKKKSVTASRLRFRIFLSKAKNTHIHYLYLIQAMRHIVERILLLWNKPTFNSNMLLLNIFSYSLKGLSL